MKISNKKIDELIKSKNWVWFAENRDGNVYWNEITGEIIFRNDEEKYSNISKPRCMTGKIDSK